MMQQIRTQTRIDGELANYIARTRFGEEAYFEDLWEEHFDWFREEVLQPSVSEAFPENRLIRTAQGKLSEMEFFYTLQRPYPAALFHTPENHREDNFLVLDISPLREPRLPRPDFFYGNFADLTEIQKAICMRWKIVSNRFITVIPYSSFILLTAVKKNGDPALFLATPTLFLENHFIWTIFVESGMTPLAINAGIEVVLETNLGFFPFMRKLLAPEIARRWGDFDPGEAFQREEFPRSYFDFLWMSCKGFRVHEGQAWNFLRDKFLIPQEDILMEDESAGLPGKYLSPFQIAVDEAEDMFEVLRQQKIYISAK